MKFIMQNKDNELYLVVDTTLCVSQNSIRTLDEALVIPLSNIMSNNRFCHVEDEATILQHMSYYIDWTFIQFVYDEPASYEYW